MRRQSRPALMTRRFSESDSVSPRQTAAIDSARRWPHSSRSSGRSVGPSTPKSWSQVSPSPPMQPRRALLDDAQAEVLEDRHRLRQLDLAAQAVHPDAREPLGLVAHADVEGGAAGEQALEVRDVVGRGRRRHGSLVGVGQARGPALGEYAAALVAVARYELLARAVVPRARELEDLGLELAEGDVGHVALGAVHGEVHAHAVLLAEHLVGVDRGRVEALGQEAPAVARSGSCRSGPSAAPR